MDKRITEKEGYKDSAVWFLCISVFALLVRVAVSLHPYSGAGNPPKYGDFEAQRHWMEITLGLPPKEWYRNSTINDLSYWGLDYPPLTAYQSYVHGLLLRYFHPDSVSLYTSRGHESYLGKLLMRWTVLLSDALIFFPAVLCFVIAYYSGQPSTSKNNIAWHTTIILLSPCLILIDHGHFQYNCISLGLTVGAIAAIISGKELVGSSLFCLALNHKQNATAARNVLENSRWAYPGSGSGVGASTGISGEDGVSAGFGFGDGTGLGIGAGARSCVGVDNIKTKAHDALGAVIGGSARSGAYTGGGVASSAGMGPRTSIGSRNGVGANKGARTGSGIGSRVGVGSGGAGLHDGTSAGYGVGTSTAAEFGYG